VAGGWLAGTNAARLALGLAPLTLPPTTMAGALLRFITEAPASAGRKGGFQPMPPNFGLLPELPVRIREKRLRYGAYRDRSLADLESSRRERGGPPAGAEHPRDLAACAAGASGGPASAG
jgi:methylenetetrahydrofolate--tRNA-(uracil-5-)-methyltransferase